MSDYLQCTECGAETNVSADSMFEQMGKTKRGTWRKSKRWIKTLLVIVAGWRCDPCLDAFEQAHGGVK